MRKLVKLPYVLLILLVLSACSSGGFKADHKYKIEPFEFTNQHNEKVSLDDLKGKVWLAQFVFTTCTSVCGPMMFHMAELQDDLIKNGVEDYKIVSFTVDPEYGYTRGDARISRPICNQSRVIPKRIGMNRSGKCLLVTHKKKLRNSR